MNHYLHFYHHHILMCDHYHNFQVLLVFIYDLCDNYLFNSHTYIGVLQHALMTMFIKLQHHHHHHHREHPIMMIIMI